MNKTELKAYRQSLLSLKNRVTGDVSHLANEALRKSPQDAGGNLSNMPIHMADLGTDNFEQELSLNLLANEEQVLGEIEAALRRIDDGSFGACEECQKPIAKERLKELPFARLCISCASKLEQRS
jgi:RNA polymerase-binding protein DksA